MASIEGLRQLQARLTALGEPQPVLRSLQIAGIGGIKKEAPRKTGHLGRSIVPGAVTAAYAVIEIRTPYAAAQNSGSGLYGPRKAKYPIVPKRKKALAWGGARRLSGTLRSGAQATNFATRVMHPGVKGSHFVERGVEGVFRKIGDLLIGRWNEAA